MSDPRHDSLPVCPDGQRTPRHSRRQRLHEQPGGMAVLRRRLEQPGGAGRDGRGPYPGLYLGGIFRTGRHAAGDPGAGETRGHRVASHLPATSTATPRISRCISTPTPPMPRSKSGSPSSKKVRNQKPGLGSSDAGLLLDFHADGIPGPIFLWKGYLPPVSAGRNGSFSDDTTSSFFIGISGVFRGILDKSRPNAAQFL